MDGELYDMENLCSGLQARAANCSMTIAPQYSWLTMQLVVSMQSRGLMAPLRQPS